MYDRNITAHSYNVTRQSLFYPTTKTSGTIRLVIHERKMFKSKENVPLGMYTGDSILRSKGHVTTDSSDTKCAVIGERIQLRITGMPPRAKHNSSWLQRQRQRASGNYSIGISSESLCHN